MRHSRRRAVAAAGLLLTAAAGVGCGTRSSVQPGEPSKPSSPSARETAPVPPFPTEPVPPEPAPEPAEFRHAWKRWRAADVGSYALGYRISCSCPDRGPVAVAVRDGRVVEARGTSTPLTVVDLFAVARRAYAQADRVTARYEPSSGIPLRLSVDIDEASRGEEIHYRVFRFQQQP